MSLTKKYFKMEVLRTSKGESVIPKGLYCSGCPYQDYDDSQPSQSNGFCWFLGKGDWDFNQEVKWQSRETGEVESADEIGLPMSLLWDGCKECGINDDFEDEVSPSQKINSEIS